MQNNPKEGPEATKEKQHVTVVVITPLTLIRLILVSLLCLITYSLIGGFIIGNADGNGNYNFYRLAAGQILASGMVFILPCLYTWHKIGSIKLSTIPWTSYASKSINYCVIALCIAMMISGLKFVEWSQWLNIKIIEYLGYSQQIIESSQSSNRIAAQLINLDTWYNGLLSLFVIAITAAVSEELFFRATLQRIMFMQTNNAANSIISAAAIFSIMHMQFDVFLPRLALGVILGFAYHYSGQRVWVSMLMHALNNSLVIMTAALSEENVETLLNSLPQQPQGVELWITLASGLAIMTSMQVLKSLYDKHAVKLANRH